MNGYTAQVLRCSCLFKIQMRYLTREFIRPGAWCTIRTIILGGREFAVPKTVFLIMPAYLNLWCECLVIRPPFVVSYATSDWAHTFAPSINHLRLFKKPRKFDCLQPLTCWVFWNVKRIWIPSSLGWAAWTSINCWKISLLLIKFSLLYDFTFDPITFQIPTVILWMI